MCVPNRNDSGGVQGRGGWSDCWCWGPSATFGQGMYYKEIHKDGRIYVFNNAENAARFEASGEMAGPVHHQDRRGAKR